MKIPTAKQEELDELKVREMTMSTQTADKRKCQSIGYLQLYSPKTKTQTLPKILNDDDDDDDDGRRRQTGVINNTHVNVAIY